MKQLPTATLVANLKREAKKLARAGGTTHSEALNQLAVSAGYADWHSLQQSHLAARAADAPTSQVDAALPLDPPLPSGFDHTPNEERSKAEIDQWWDRPYGVTRDDGTIEVRCLDGGCWDRSTSYGIAPDLAAAEKLAVEKLARWRAARERPTVYLDDGYSLVRMPQRPGEEMEVLATVDSPEAVSQWLRDHDYER